MRGYVGAVLVSVGIALISRSYLAPRLSVLKGGAMVLANAALNYVAAAFAGATNVTLMRAKELTGGISIFNK